jgi:hypothetical protein
MKDFERAIDIRVKGENTQQMYEGCFIVKLFLTQAEKLKSIREIRSKVGDLEAMAASWSLRSYLDIINSLPEEATEGEDAIFVSPTAKRIIVGSIASCLPNIPPAATMIGDIYSLNARIVEAPDFWKKANNGLDLLDEAPIQEVWKQLNELIQEFVKPDEDEKTN